ncbi:MAG: basic amino acid/polyamine antiporter, family [Miltoncostaeaceae bacterium]|nr:basic amino acid/polyamine antiporter, family [Miltoncostaeaceae bacterium]
MPPRRRRHSDGLERVLGAPALSATAYGNVGSSIYYALGVTAAFALGLTPLVFVIAGLIFAATAATYAEGTVRFPEAGGSSSFARHAFNELVSFGAAWAQMLNYIITIAISAFFVPHYLSIFWEPLKEPPWDVVVGSAVVVLLVAVNIVGVQEAAKLNIILGVIDFATQVLLVILGAILILDPGILADNVDFGVTPTWGQFLLAIPVGMIAYTGIETISNLAEETRDPLRDIPRSIRVVAIAVFAIYFTLPAIALSALPVVEINGERTTLLGVGPENGGYANDPVLGVVENLGLSGAFHHILGIYVGVLAATILLIAANAGVIGASRITYAMAGYRQLPERFRRLHPRFRTPWLSLVVFAGVAAVAVMLPGQTNFLGTMYAFGAMLSFTIAHASIVALRIRRREEEPVYRARPNLRLGGIDWPLFAVLGGLGTGAAFVVVLVQEPLTRWVGLGWLAFGLVCYAIYRRSLAMPLRRTARAPALVLGPSLELDYRAIVVPVVRSGASEEALLAAVRLAGARRGARLVIVTVLEVPLELPLDVRRPELVREAGRLLDDARALVESYGVRATPRLIRARRAGDAIALEAARQDADLVVIGAARRASGRREVFGKTVDTVLRESPCRVLVAARGAAAKGAAA